MVVFSIARVGDNMFNRAINWMKGVMAKVGLIKKLEQVTDHKKISLSDSYYENILKWRALHQGYYSKMHDVHYQTIEGPQKRKRATMNMPKMATQELATLIFNERCEITVSDDGFNEFIQEVFKNNAFNGNFQQYLEFMFAQGGMVIKPYVDKGVLKLSYVTADCFLPISWDNTRITEGVFISEINKQGKKYTLLEWHTFENSVYTIKNELYESTHGQDIGTKVALSTLYPDLAETFTDSTVKRPLFAYFKPNLANNVDSTVPLGISIYANAYDTLKSIDISFDSFQREFRLGRKRILVPTSAIKTVVDKETNTMRRYFDSTDEVYEAMDTSMDDNKVTEINSTLRVTEHVDSINAHLNIFAAQIGFSAGAFSFNGQSVKTATEVVSENSKTFRTKQSHENVIEQGITDLIEAIGIVAEIYDLYTPPKDYDVTVAFDDSVAEDIGMEIDKQIKLVGAELNSKQRAIMKIFGISDKEALKIIKEIREETLRNAPEYEEVKKKTSLFGSEE